ncbi:amidohydrolase [Pandoraea anapnoica]|uniref:Amidohydrolase n=1 Tax=Pandoraea anapnoica TaxID=2508301 RepID=A0A5E5ASH8_9BURK|nr:MULTISPECIES: amidohydrolase [Pandoraea]VVE58597.1 amidohydrolase [Pandoraea iniqua]VVE75060.1 amidohydrolase [Pandoraea anapnoica]
MCQACVGNFFGRLGALSGLKSSNSFSRRRFLATAAGAGLILPSMASAYAKGSGGGGSAVQIDYIFRGGPIIPLASKSTADGPFHDWAVAVKGERIVAAGPESEIMAQKSASTQVIDLAGRSLLPGFIDPHQHTVTGALIKSVFTYCGYSPMKPEAPKGYPNRKAVIDLIAKQASQTPPGQWLLFYAYDNLLQGDGMHGGGGDFWMPDLDAISTQHPILVYYINMHTAAGNSTAFKAAGISTNTDAGDLNKKLMANGGGHFGQNPNGTPNGVIYEMPALAMFSSAIPPEKLTPENAGAAVAAWLATNASYGNTCIHEAGLLLPGAGGDNLIGDYMAVANEASCRASVSLMVDSPESLKAAEPYKKFGYGAKATRIPNTQFSIYGMKVVGDGSNQTRTAAQRAPYLDGTNGTPNYTPEALKELVASVKAAGWPLLIHCNGSQTIDNALDAIEASYGAHPSSGVNRIEHCTMVTSDQLDRMARLGVQPSFLMNHVYFYGAAYRDQLFGPRRTVDMDPAGGCVSRNLPFTLHTDAPCSNLGTLQLVQTAVTRQCNIDSSVIGKAQAVSLTNALRAVTNFAAGQIGMADELGSIEAGKLADFAILESDPYAVDPTKLMDINVSETWVGGQKKFAA